MTREEAISYGNNYYIELISACCKISEKHKDFVKMSLEALEQKPCEDAISRQVVLDLVCADWKYEGLESDIANLPPVTPQLKTGHWIWELDETPSTYMSPSELNYAGWVCSCCHEFPDDVCEWDDPDEPPTYKFCPNCGTKMERII